MSEQECVGVIVKFTHGDETRRQTLPAVESLTELKDIAFELFDASLPDDFMLAYTGTDHSFLLTSDRSFQEAERLSMSDTCVVNGLSYYTLHLTVYGKDAHDLPSPREDLLFDKIEGDEAGDDGDDHNNTQEQQQQQQSQTSTGGFPLTYSNETEGDGEITSVDPQGESLDGVFQVEKALDINFDDPDDVDDYEHDGFMSDQNGFMPDDPNDESDDNEEEQNSTNLSKQNNGQTAVVPGYGASAVGVVFSALKTALLAPTFFCSSCSSSSSSGEGKENQNTKTTQ